MAATPRLMVGSSAEEVECRDELITDILSRVSTTDLLKMCTVRKRWRTLIFDPGFAHTHHKNCHRQSMFIFSEEITKPIGGTLSRAFQFRSYNPQTGSLSIVPLSLEGLDIKLNLNRPDYLVTASNGLLCFNIVRPNVKIVEFLLYNPVTKFEKKLILPCGTDKEGLDLPFFIGFCSTQNTAKLVIGRWSEEDRNSMVFDSQSNSWYKGPPPFSHINEASCSFGHPFFFNGVIYFLLRTPILEAEEGQEPRDVEALFRDEDDHLYVIIGYDVNQDQWCFSVFIPTSVGYPYCLIEWEGKLLVLASNSTHEENLFVLAASSTHDRSRKIRYAYDEGDGHFVFWILDTEQKLWTREWELDLSHEFHGSWQVSASGGVVWLENGYNSVIVYQMKNRHYSTHRLNDALAWQKGKYVCVSFEPTLLSF